MCLLQLIIAMVPLAQCVWQGAAPSGTSSAKTIPQSDWHIWQYALDQVSSMEDPFQANIDFAVEVHEVCELITTQ